MNEIIYHVCTNLDWQTAKQNGTYTHASFTIEGFIHCSTQDQVVGVLDRFFKGQTDLVILVLQTNLIKQELKFELAPSINQYFPHIFGDINIDAVVNTLSVDEFLNIK
jgi:uncharacterized protein (DUF952 family)